MAYLRFLAIFISQYLSDADQKLLVALLLIGAYDRETKSTFP